ncbi:MAG: hypothetical protein QXX95_03080 [Nitrososphaerales archaeon]
MRAKKRYIVIRWKEGIKEREKESFLENYGKKVKIFYFDESKMVVRCPLNLLKKFEGELKNLGEKLLVSGSLKQVKLKMGIKIFKR